MTSLVLSQCASIAVISNNKFDSMEVPLQAGSQNPDTRDTYRSVKPPDQCVISYNFEHANSLNFTHNLLIGMGLDEPTRKPHSSLAQPNKQKLFSIIPQPKRVFRNEATSVSKAYNATILPRRYHPEKQKQQSNSNSSQHTPMDGRDVRERDSKDRSSHPQQDRSHNAEGMKSFTDHDSFLSADANSPYGVLSSKQKGEKTKFNKNQKAKTELNPLTNFRRDLSPNARVNPVDLLEANPFLENSLTHEEQIVGENSIREVSEDKQELQSSCLRQADEGEHFEGQSNPNQKIVQQVRQQSLHLVEKDKSKLSIKPEEPSKEDIHNNSIAIEPTPKQESVIGSANNHHDSRAQLETKKYALSTNPNKQSSPTLDNQFIQEDSKTKSRKQIQDEQLDQLEMRVRRDDSAMFKKGHFRVGGNKEKQILPFQASIEPLFNGNSKQSLSQHPKTNNSIKNNAPFPKNSSHTLNSANNRGNQLNPSKIAQKKSTDNPSKSNNALNGNHPNFTQASPNSKLKNINSDSLAKNASRQSNPNINIRDFNPTSKARDFNSNNKTRDSNANPKPIDTNTTNNNIVKTSNFMSPNQNKTEIRDKENLKTSNSIKKQSTNLTAIAATQKIKRNQESKPKNIKTQTTEKQKSINTNPVTEDLTANNQIKGFKIPEKTVSSKLSKLVKAESISEIHQRSSGFDPSRFDQQLKKKGNEGKQMQKISSQSTSSLNNPKSNIQTQKQSNNTGKGANDTLKKTPKDSEKQRFSEIASDAVTRRKDMDEVVTDNKATNRSKFKPSPTRANQSAFMANEAQRSASKQKMGRVSDQPLKPTVGRQSRDKDYRFKKWRDAELQEVEKERRQSKRRQQSNASKNKEKQQSKRSQSKLKPKRNKEIDLDAEEDDKFGLFSKRKSNSKNKMGKNTRQQNKKENVKTLVGPQARDDERQQQEVQLSDKEDNASNNQQFYEDLDEKKSDFNESQLDEQQVINKQDEELMNENLQKISSIHSSKITEQEEDPTERATEKRKSLPQTQNLEELLKATEESPSPNKLQVLPVDIQLEESNLQEQEAIFHQNTDATNKEVGEKHQISDVKAQNTYKQKSEIEQQGEKEAQDESIKAINAEPTLKSQLEQKIIIEEEKKLSNENQVLRTKNEDQKINDLLCEHNQPQVSKVEGQPGQRLSIQHEKSDSLQVEVGPSANVSNKQEDFFEYNMKEMSKFNETANQTFNITKYETFDRDLAQYNRAPILSFLYGSTQTSINQINSFVPSSKRTSLLDEGSLGESGEEIIDQAINILLSIDHWIIQRIFQPFLNNEGEIGVWLYWQGFWKIMRVSGENFRVALRNAVGKFSKEVGLQCGLEEVLRLISGVRVAKLKSSKKRVLHELDYSLNKKHVLKAVTAKNSKWGERMFEVVKVETSKQGGNVLKLKEKSEYFWVREEKFQQIFQHFLLICTRPSHFWTISQIASKQSHKSVLHLSSDAAVHGSVTLYYPSEQRSSLCLYKQLQSKVLRFMGKIQEKINQNGNLYFQFRMHGTYYLFLQTPADCDLAIESTTKLTIGQPEYIVSQTLKNDKCEYVEIEHTRNSNRPGSKQMETLEKLRQKFINMVSTK